MNIENLNKTYEVVYHGDYGSSIPEDDLHEILESNEIFSEEIKSYGIIRFMSRVPRHHPELVKCIKILLSYAPKASWRIETIESPMYTITEEDGKETVISIADLDCDASEFN